VTARGDAHAGFRTLIASLAQLAFQLHNTARRWRDAAQPGHHHFLEDDVMTMARINYIKRHLFNVAPHLTVKKVANVILNEMEKRKAVAIPRSLPPYLKVDSSPYCHLKCRGCRDQNLEIRTGNLSLENFRNAIDPIADTLIGVSLSFSGEPFMNKKLLPIIEYIHSKNIGVSFPSHFSLPFSEEKMERLAASGLDSLYVSLDGASRDTYKQYRIGGDFDLVVENVRRLSEAKKKLGVSRPRIVWKFVVFEHNKHEMAFVKENHKSMGFDDFTFQTDRAAPSVRKDKINRKKRMFEEKLPCFWAWNTIFLSSSGQVSPCCHSWEFKLGNGFQEDIPTIWRSKAYADVRRGFSKKDYGGESMNKICQRCLGIWDGKQRWG
jgi:MoaA/NifB/PqqE/SkfB family radical SAM enzyme